MIHIIREKVAPDQLTSMLDALNVYIKIAVDIEREILAGGGILHADCEAALIDDGSDQQHIWGADWIPESQELRFEALINIRPAQNNPAMTVQDQTRRKKIETITRRLLGGVACR